MRIPIKLTFLTIALIVIGCDEQPDVEPLSNSSASKLSSPEQEIIATLLSVYSDGAEDPLPPVLSSHIGMGEYGPLEIQNLRLDYNRNLDIEYINTLANEPPERLTDIAPVINSHSLTEALNSLVKVNQTPVNAAKVGKFRTVSVNELNQDLINLRNDADNFWRSFDAKYPENAGFSTSSRVGFSNDGNIAVVYFTWTGGPTLGLGAVHILQKSDSGWELIGRWRKFGWTS